MNAWLVRGLGMALIHVVIRAALGAAIAQWPLQGSILRWLSLAVVVVIAAIWGGIDGIRDRRDFPEAEDGADLTMIWLKAAILGGFVAGAVSWILSRIPKLELTQQGFFFEITSGAAFTILLIFVPAMIAVTVGRFFVSRDQRKKGTAPQFRSHDRHPDSDSDADAAGTHRAPDAHGENAEHHHGETQSHGNAVMSVEDSDADTASFPPVRAEEQRH